MPFAKFFKGIENIIFRAQSFERNEKSSREAVATYVVNRCNVRSSLVMVFVAFIRHLWPFRLAEETLCVLQLL